MSLSTCVLGWSTYRLCRLLHCWFACPQSSGKGLGATVQWQVGRGAGCCGYSLGDCLILLGGPDAGPVSPVPIPVGGGSRQVCPLGSPSLLCAQGGLFLSQRNTWAQRPGAADSSCCPWGTVLQVAGASCEGMQPGQEPSALLGPKSLLPPRSTILWNLNGI